MKTLNLLVLRKAIAGFLPVCLIGSALGQASATLGSGMSAAAIARGGTTAAQSGSPVDAIEGNPAGLAGTSARTLDFGAVGLTAFGSFSNAANPNASLRGVAGAMPFGAFAMPLGKGPWRLGAGVTPEVLMRANWHYVDAPGTLGVTYGYQQHETQIVAIRSSLGAARSFGNHWSAGATVGIVYNQNDLHAPYIFQQQPQLAGLKVLLALTTKGYGWNGSAGLQWHPSSRLRAGLAWKSGTFLRTQGDASGTASALFTALGVMANPVYAYHAQVLNKLPPGFDAGVNWELRKHLRLDLEGDFTAWGQAFQQLPVTLTGGTNAVINSVAGSTTVYDNVPLRWSNQATFRVGIESPLSDSLTVRAGYSYTNDPVPSSTLTPLTAAIMQNTIGTGVGWSHGHWRYDAAYQAQLPSTKTVGQSAILAGEYDNSSVRVSTQSLTLTAQVAF